MTVLREMPKYRCHKEVWALKIATIVIDGEGEPNRETDGSAMRKHKPQAGGYYVLYKDGYTSFSPADAFEDGYTRI